MWIIPSVKWYLFFKSELHYLQNLIKCLFLELLWVSPLCFLDGRCKSYDCSYEKYIHANHVIIKNKRVVTLLEKMLMWDFDLRQPHRLIEIKGPITLPSLK